MNRRKFSTGLLTLLGLSCGMILLPSQAWAQRNTYEDFPYNQGSLFYRYLPPKKTTRKVYRPVLRPAPVPPQTSYSYPQTNTYSQAPSYYYNPQTRSYYYYPTTPVPTQPVPDRIGRGGLPSHLPVVGGIRPEAVESLTSPKRQRAIPANSLVGASSLYGH